jgi:hypothetical protein
MSKPRGNLEVLLCFSYILTRTHNYWEFSKPFSDTCLPHHILCSLIYEMNCKDLFCKQVSISHVLVKTSFYRLLSWIYCSVFFKPVHNIYIFFIRNACKIPTDSGRYFFENSLQPVWLISLCFHYKFTWMLYYFRIFLFYYINSVQYGHTLGLVLA